MTIAACVLVLAAVQAAGKPAAPPAVPPVIVVSDTGGKTADGLPIFTAHPDAPRYTAVLSRGYAGRVARLYLLVQRFARPQGAVHPSYLALTDNQGGFPRRGFFLDGPQADVAYIDLHRRSSLSGHYGAIDQIFPHEMLHVIVGLLAGEAPEGHATQVHAVGVRTDRITAFNEGFAEHGQIMAIDDPGAAAESRALAYDVVARDRAIAAFEAYRRALTARWSVATRAAMTFPVWFSQGEQVLRYHAVRDNLFAREPALPPRLLTGSRAYRAYLLENVTPGAPADALKPASRLLSTEGVVSALFFRIVTDAAIQAHRAPPSLYAAFGTTSEATDGLDNAYLKVFASIRKAGYDALAIARAHQTLFPEDAAAVEAILQRTFGALPPAPPPEFWLINERFQIGSSLFDQFRGAPQPHAFDLNAASPADLAGVPAVDPALAAAILRAAPFGTVDDLSRVPGMTVAALSSFRQMREAALRPPAAGTEREGRLSFRTMLMPYAWRALAVWLGCAVASAWLYRAVRRISWWRLALNGLGAALVGLLAGWTIDGGNGLLALAAPIALFGMPGAVWRLWRSHSPVEAAAVVGAWASAAVAAALAVVPLG